MNNRDLVQLEHGNNKVAFAPESQDNRFAVSHHNDDDDGFNVAGGPSLKKTGVENVRSNLAPESEDTLAATGNSIHNHDDNNRERANYFVEMNERGSKFPSSYPVDDATFGTTKQYQQGASAGSSTADSCGDDAANKEKNADAAFAINITPTSSSSSSSSLPFSLNIFLQKVFILMFVALVITACVSLFILHINADVWLNNHPAVFIFLLIFEVFLVFASILFLSKISYVVAVAIFVLYAVLNGVTLTPIISYYAESSVAIAFFSASSVFLSMALYGYVTNKDLSAWGPLLTSALIGLIVAGLFNIFLRSSTTQIVVSSCGVLIFTALTAYDVSTLKKLGEQLGNKATTDESSKIAVFGALNLYLDFINVFLYLLQILGKSDS